MIFFEHTVGDLTEVEPLYLTTDAPFVWKWRNGVDAPTWYEDLFPSFTPSERVNIQLVTFVLGEVLRPTETKLSMYDTDNSFYFDEENQIVYMHTNMRWLPAQASIELNALVGYTDKTAFETDSSIYLPLIAESPNVSISVDPLVYGRMAHNNFSVTLRNDELYRLDKNNKPYKTYRFDDMLPISGQLAYLRIGESDDEYDDFILAYKAYIEDHRLYPDRVNITAKDVRGFISYEHPTDMFDSLTDYADYMEDNIKEKLIPDGYGTLRHIPAYPLNSKDTSSVVYGDDDDVRYSLYQYFGTSKLGNFSEAETWSTEGTITILETTKQFGNRETFYVEKGNSNEGNYIYDSFTPTDDFIVCGYFSFSSIEDFSHDQKVAIEVYNATTSSSIYSLSITNDLTLPSSETGTAYNMRYVFLGDTGETIVFFTFEIRNVTDLTQIRLYPDKQVGETNIEAYFAGISVLDATYPTFKIADSLTSISKVYKLVDENLVEIKKIISTDTENGTFCVSPVDCHIDGDLSKGQYKLFADATLRSETNPLDIIADLNERIQGFSYLEDFYDISRNSIEKEKLADIAYYMDSRMTLFEHFETIQSGSDVGFQYDDKDKIRILVDDPNKTPKRTIYKEKILNKADLEVDYNLTLYATEAIIEYNKDYRTGDYEEYHNTDYRSQSLRIHKKPKTETIPTLLTNATDAENKSIILLDDLSAPKPIYNIELDTYEYSDLYIYDIVWAELELLNRTYAGMKRCQIIGIQYNTREETMVLTLRERPYSQDVADIIGTDADILAFHKQLSADVFDTPLEDVY